jgi:hypothetical protein
VSFAAFPCGRAFGLVFLLSPLLFLFAHLSSALLLFLVCLALLFGVALTLLRLCFRFSFGRGCDGGGGIGDLCCRCSTTQKREDFAIELSEAMSLESRLERVSPSIIGLR